MIARYDILLADQLIGSAEVFREGLYYRFRCRCQLSGDVMYQLKVFCAEKENCLGICVPVAGGFGVDTKLPVKKIGEGNMTFYAVPRHLDLQGKFVPIRADEPFSYIEKLQNACLTFQNGVQGIIIDEINN